MNEEDDEEEKISHTTDSRAVACVFLWKILFDVCAYIEIV